MDEESRLKILTETDVALRSELLGLGWTDPLLRRAMADGSLVRVRHGAYVDGEAWRVLDSAGRHELVARSVIARSGAQAVASHASSLAVWRAPTWGLDLAMVHVTRPDERAGRAEAGVRQHRGLLPPEDVRLVRGAAVTSPERAALELATIVDSEVALVQLNDLLHRGLVTVESLRARYEDGMQRWPGSLATDLVLRLSDRRCESVAESRFLYLCWRCGLPAPTLQHEVYDGGVLVARLDFCWPRLGAWVEVDGMAKYTTYLRPGETASDVVIREKRREDLVRRLTGMRCMRVTWPELEQRDRTAWEVGRFLQGGPTTPATVQAA